MTNNWKRSIVVLAWCCLSCSAQAQQQPDSTQLRRQVAGQAFPFPNGVALELGLYRRLQRQGTVVEQLLTSKEERLRNLSTELQLSQQLYADCAQRLRAAEAAGARQAATIAELTRVSAEGPPRPTAGRWQVLGPTTGVALLVGLLVGVAVTR